MNERGKQKVKLRRHGNVFFFSYYSVSCGLDYTVFIYIYVNATLDSLRDCLATILLITFAF